MKRTLLVPDVDALARKLAHPPPLLGKLYARFQTRMPQDCEFRRNHIFLPALLGDPIAMAEAKGLILTLGLNPWILAREQSPGSKVSSPDSLDHHIWCVAPRAMRLAVYFTWLDARDAWTADERRLLGAGLVDFFYSYVIPVLRARIPAGHNQQLSMTLCSAIVGHVFADVEGVSDRARALHNWAMPKFRQVLGLMPASGYSGEGSTYQSDVVSGLVLWAGHFLEQLGERDVWHRRWAPNNSSLADTLRMETALGSCGGLLPPWDNYGWQPLHNLAARTFWAGLSGQPALLQAADAAWDVQGQLAWRPDDRLWTVIYWPASEEFAARASCEAGIPGAAPESGSLAGWSQAAIGAAIDHVPRRLRVMVAWDRCSGDLQGVGRAQVNPNHLMIDLSGEPISMDGFDNATVHLCTPASLARTRQALSVAEREMVVRQYGSEENWALRTQQGFLGMSCAILVDAWESYFPREVREGRLVFERRTRERHTFAGESAAYYQPVFDVTRMRRTVSMGTAGIVWMVDEIRAGTVHDFTWRLWLRRGVRATGPLGVRLDLASGVSTTWGWHVEGDGAQTGAVQVTPVPAFPLRRSFREAVSDEGSDRCDLAVTGRRVRFVTCLVPEGVDGLVVRSVATNEWVATWTGGSDGFVMPAELAAMPDPAPVAGRQIAEAHTVCDLEEAPFALLTESDADLLAALDHPPVDAWRRTGAAMQTLTARGNRAAMPRIVALLEDARQNYTVHSVAIWCLGWARYSPAVPLLAKIAHLPEINAAARARWALERFGVDVSQTSD